MTSAHKWAKLRTKSRARVRHARTAADMRAIIAAETKRSTRMARRAREATR